MLPPTLLRTSRERWIVQEIAFQRKLAPERFRCDPRTSSGWRPDDSYRPGDLARDSVQLSFGILAGTVVVPVAFGVLVRSGGGWVSATPSAVDDLRPSGEADVLEVAPILGITLMNG